MKLRRNSRLFKVLKYLAIGAGVLIVSSIAPAGSPQIIRGIIGDYIRKKRFRREMFLRDLKRLQTRKLVDYQELPDGRIKIILTKNGKEKMLTYNIDDITLATDKKWDGQWRLIIFDVPHGFKKARDAFRLKLKELKFYPLQKSVFITPYPCEDELDFIASFYNIRKYLLILYISHFEGSEKLKYHFNLK